VPDAAGSARVVPKPPRLNDRICLRDEERQGRVAHRLGASPRGHLRVGRMSGCRIIWTMIDRVDAVG
jgi:hypothetical protein